MGDPALRPPSSGSGQGRGREQGRGRRRAIGAALLACVWLGAGCTAVGIARRALREPGATLLTLPDDVADKYECSSRRLPYFVFEKQEVNPKRVYAGDEFNHRFVYALCPRRATEVVTGTLRTRIRYKDRVIVQDEDEEFELQPGRWAVDSFVRLPDAASVGVYAIELEFTSRRVKFEHEATFGVDAR